MAATQRPQSVTAMRPGHLRLVRGDASGLLAHDLKTPLAAIAMNLDFALGELGPGVSDSVRSALEDCRESNHRAVGIVSDMVDALRLSSGQTQASLGPVDAQAQVAESVRRIASEAAARGVRLSWTAEAAIVHGDGDLLGRVLDRLLERALRYARAGGAIEVALRDGRIVTRIAPAGGSEVASDPDATMHSLAMHFAEAAMRAQGGAVWTELDSGGALLFVVSLTPGDAGEVAGFSP